MKKKIIATIEARMTSTRLPGKVLLEVLGKPMIVYQIERIKKVQLIDQIVLATTKNSEDNCLEELALSEKISFFRGDENNVMQRIIDAGSKFSADIIVELTGDSPIIDPEIIYETIKIFLEKNVDYVSNNNIRSYPDGMDTQVFNLETLKKSSQLTKDPLDHEHVTLHIRKNPEIFSQINLSAPKSLFWPELGLTLDEQDDYLLIKNIRKSTVILILKKILTLKSGET